MRHGVMGFQMTQEYNGDPGDSNLLGLSCLSEEDTPVSQTSCHWKMGSLEYLVLTPLALGCAEKAL